MSGKRGNRGKSGFYGDHDDRTQANYGPSRRQRGRGRGQIYRPPRGQGNYRGGGSGPNPRSRLVDDDDMMHDQDRIAGQTHTNRHNPYGRRPYNNRRRGGRGYDNRRYQSGGYGGRYQRPNPNSWFKVIIPRGAEHDKQFILQQISQFCSEPFVPLLYGKEGMSAVFYVKDKKAADAIRAVSRRITLPRGLKMIIIVKDTPPPPTPINEETVMKLKICMSNRYDPAAKSLNLGNLYHDEDMKKEGLHISLAKHEVMIIVIKIIEEHIPEIESLDMSSSSLYGLEDLKLMVVRTPGIKKLNLGNNKLRDERELTKVKGWELLELNLDGNPLCDKFQDKQQYISAIRKIFPKVVRLDGNELPPVITFDVEETTKLPPSQGSYFMNDQCKAVIVKFVEQFVGLYDSGNRQKLLEAYHDQAIFSLTCSQSVNKGQRSKYREYMNHDRNLKSNTASSYRDKLLKVGRLNIVALLNDLPATQHDPASFSVDVHHAADQMLSFSLHGVFRERDSKQDPQPVRSFSRMFVLVPQGAGVVVVNEELSIANATADQIKNSFKSPAPTPSSSPVLASPSQDQQLLLVQEFAAKSSMNLEWSRQCLVQNDWEFAKAAQVFMELKEKGSIPEEAFK